MFTAYVLYSQNMMRYTLAQLPIWQTVLVTQENSYYGFGLVMPNSPVGTTGTSNKQLCNGGSEWQNDYSNLPDYYQTYYRNYDAALARWVGVDPMAEATESMTPYHYSGNNPIMFNDPLGNAFKTPAAGYSGDSHYEGPNNMHIGSSFVNYLENEAEPMDYYNGEFTDNVFSAGGGLNSDGLPTDDWVDYATDIYHSGNGTPDDPATGSLANGIANINAVAKDQGYTVAILANTFDYYVGADGKVLIETAHQGDKPGHYFHATDAGCLGGQDIYTSYADYKGAISIEVMVVDTHAPDVGHTAIELAKNYVFGYYPNGGSEGNPSSGELMHSKASPEIVTKEHFNAECYLERGYREFDLKISTDQLISLDKTFSGLMLNPGYYDLLFKNCTSVVISGLIDAGVPLHGPTRGVCPHH
ncbi:MAG: RHS repeat-associated core domain-containing protein [Mucilaginibacter sp.]